MNAVLHKYTSIFFFSPVITFLITSRVWSPEKSFLEYRDEHKYLSDQCKQCFFRCVGTDSTK